MFFDITTVHCDTLSSENWKRKDNENLPLFSLLSSFLFGCILIYISNERKAMLKLSDARYRQLLVIPADTLIGSIYWTHTFIEVLDLPRQIGSKSRTWSALRERWPDRGAIKNGRRASCQSRHTLPASRRPTCCLFSDKRLLAGQHPIDSFG